MSRLSIADKTFLEAVLGMHGGHVVDFTNTSFAQFFNDLGIDIYDEQYAEYGPSKANRLRALWQAGSDGHVSAALSAIADYLQAKKAVGGLREDISDEQIDRIREIAKDLAIAPPTSPAGEPMPITTHASVTRNNILIEIHDDIYSHIGPYLVTDDYFHAVEESYKLVREKLRELTGSEKASDVFTNSAQSDAHYEALFGKPKPSNAAEADFFRGIGYLHLGVQHLRNEKAHTPATPLEPNLALHYISLASLAYDLITRYVSDETILEIEEVIRRKRYSYRSATAFYREFSNHKWLDGLELPASIGSTSVRRALKAKWLTDADFTRSWDSSNLVLMRLELLIDDLTAGEIDHLLNLPTQDSYGNDQLAGMEQFLDYAQRRDPSKLSATAKAWIEARTES